MMVVFSILLVCRADFKTELQLDLSFHVNSLLIWVFQADIFLSICFNNSKLMRNIFYWQYQSLWVAKSNTGACYKIEGLQRLSSWIIIRYCIICMVNLSRVSSKENRPWKNTLVSKPNKNGLRMLKVWRSSLRSKRRLSTSLIF